jgi:hypothetical protein
MATDPPVTVTQFGVSFPDGSVDWNVELGFGTLDNVEQRSSYAAQYVARLASLGLAVQTVSFVTRTATTSYSDLTPVTDPPPVPTSEDTPSS